MDESQSSHTVIPPECGFYIQMGGILPHSATEAKAVLIFLAVINIVTFPFTAALNLLVIIAVKTKPQLRAHKSNILLACLATTDLMVGVLVQPIYAASVVTTALGETSIAACTVQNLTQLLVNILCNASLIHLALISGERYLAMEYTYDYHNGLVTETRLLIGSALAWLFSLILQIPLFIDKTVFFVINSSFVSLSLAVIIICQITVYGVVRRHEKEIATQQVTEEARQKFLKDKRAFKLTAIVVSVLVLCYIPITVLRIIFVIFRGNISIQVLYAGLLSTGWVTILNSLLNPLIYSVRMRQFRVAFIEITCRTANIAEAEEIEMRVFGSANAQNTAGNLEAGQAHEVNNAEGQQTDN